MNWGLHLTEKPTRRTTGIFIVLSWVGIFCVFRGAIWGTAILAPLDIPPTLYSKFEWVDPTLGKIPRNHYVIDLFDYDLAPTHLTHRSLAQGEFPWWNPYSSGGCPLAAEPLGITDPLRLTMLRLFPFVTAYNWTRILQSFLGGLGMFLLLRSLGFAQFTTVLGALSFQFAAPHSGFQYTVPPHGWYYYSYLWLVMHHCGRTRPVLGVVWGGLLCAVMFVAGTQQSHVYVALFLLCIVAGYGSCSRSDIVRLVMVAGGAFVLGCALAAPILVPQVELFLLGNRKVPVTGLGKHMLTGLLSMAGIFPWLTGSFRTLDVPRLVGHPSAAYVVYIGTAAMIVAVIGLIAGRKLPPARTATLLVLGYLVGICSTPLVNILYTRSSVLAVVGLIVLFAIGWEVLATSTWPGGIRIARALVLLLSVGIVITHVFAFAVYPRVKDKVLRVVLEKEAHSRSMPSAPDLRRFQVENLPKEITFKNPEALLAFLGALCLLALPSTNTRKRHVFAAAVFGLNLLPLLLFAQRSTPYSPIRRWNVLLEGGPEQKALINLLGRDLRMTEHAPSRLGDVFPGTTPALYRIHSLHGWASIALVGPGQGATARDHNLSYTTTPGSEKGKITLLHTNQTRFVWADKPDRSVTITRETLNSIELKIAAGPPGELVRTDTYYPGWRAERPEGIAQQRNSDGFWAFSIPAAATDLILRYRPSYFRTTAVISIAALAIAGGLLMLDARNEVKPGES